MPDDTQEMANALNGPAANWFAGYNAAPGSFSDRWTPVPTLNSWNANGPFDQPNLYTSVMHQRLDAINRPTTMTAAVRPSANVEDNRRGQMGITPWVMNNISNIKNIPSDDWDANVYLWNRIKNWWDPGSVTQDALQGASQTTRSMVHALTNPSRIH